MASQLTSNFFGWKKYKQQYKLIVQRCLAMEKNRSIYETMEEGTKKENIRGRDGFGSYGGSDLKVKTKAVAPRKVECIFCLQGNRENNHFPLSSKYCSSIQSTPEQLQRIICITKVCPTCLQDHRPEGPCDDQTQGGNPKQCREGCTLDIKPLCFFLASMGKSSGPELKQCPSEEDIM